MKVETTNPHIPGVFSFCGARGWKSWVWRERLATHMKLFLRPRQRLRFGIVASFLCVAGASSVFHKLLMCSQASAVFESFFCASLPGLYRVYVAPHGLGRAAGRPAVEKKGEFGVGGLLLMFLCFQRPFGFDVAFFRFVWGARSFNIGGAASGEHFFN